MVSFWTSVQCPTASGNYWFESFCCYIRKYILNSSVFCEIPGFFIPYDRYRSLDNFQTSRWTSAIRGSSHSFGKQCPMVNSFSKPKVRFLRVFQYPIASFEEIQRNGRHFCPWQQKQQQQQKQFKKLEAWYSRLKIYRIQI